MTILTKQMLYPGLAVLAMLAFSSAQAVIITDSGVDTTTKHYVIDSATSTVTYNPGGISFGTASTVAQTTNYTISGEFDADFSRYWWSYRLEGDDQGLQGNFTSESNWINFKNAQINGNIAPNGFEFPSFFVRINGSQMAGSAGVCDTPLSPNASCSGNQNGPIASLTGQISDGGIILNGNLPISGSGSLTENFSYQIKASVVPLPATLSLLISGLGFLSIASRSKKASRLNGHDSGR
jgi:hypothetical protein